MLTVQGIASMTPLDVNIVSGAGSGGTALADGATFTAGTTSLTPAGGFVDQVAGTAILVALIFAIVDPRNVAPPGWMGPLLVGGLVVAIGMAFGFHAG